MKKVAMALCGLLIIVATACQSGPTYQEEFKKVQVLLDEGKGIEAHYAMIALLKTMPRPESDDQQVSLEYLKNESELFAKTRDLADLELENIYLKPRMYRSTQTYYDNADEQRVRFIIAEDPKLREKYGDFVKK